MGAYQDDSSGCGREPRSRKAPQVLLRVLRTTNRKSRSRGEQRATNYMHKTTTKSRAQQNTIIAVAATHSRSSATLAPIKRFFGQGVGCGRSHTLLACVSFVVRSILIGAPSHSLPRPFASLLRSFLFLALWANGK